MCRLSQNSPTSGVALHCGTGAFLAGEVGLPGRMHRRSVAVPGLAEVERHLHYGHRGVGHPPSDRNALARAFVAKAVWDLPTTAAPSTGSGTIPRCGGFAVVGRERPAPKRRRGRPGKGERPVREPTRLERRLEGGMSTGEMVAELPKARDVGARRNAKGYMESWRGYGTHIDATDGDVPVSRIPAPASLHDSQAAIPLARMTAGRVDHRHGLMDAACDSRETGAHARMAGRMAIIDANPRRDVA